MSIITSEMIRPTVEFFETELDCSGEASHAISLDFTDDGLNNTVLNQLKERAAELISMRKQEIHQTIHDHMNAHQLDRKQLAEFLCDILHATNLSKIYKKHIDPFLIDGYCYSKDTRTALLEKLGLSASDVAIKTPDITTIHAKIESFESIQLEAFLHHFDLIWANRAGICSTPELSNITFNRLGGGLAYCGPFYVTLGQLLNLYNRGLLRHGQCETCHCSWFVYWFSGSPLSGAGQYSAFCPMCHKTKKIYPYHVSGRAWRYFAEYSLPFDRKQPTRWTVTTLVHALDPNYNFAV